MSKPILTDLDFSSSAKILNMPDPSLPQHVATKAYVDSAVEGLAWKDSVRVASTSNISLAAPGATINGVTMALNDRFLVKDQTTASQNGIYIYNGSTVPATRSLDTSTSSELEQAIVTVEEGSSATASFRQTSVNFIIDTDDVLWTPFAAAAPAATESTAGVAEIATQAETDAGVDDTRIVTPAKLANHAGRKLKVSQIIGDGSATSFNIDHNFNTRDNVVSVSKTSGNYDDVICEVTRPTLNRVPVVFSSAPASSSLKVVVIA